ncbi:MAG: hypothetical protein WBG57_09100, partial [Ornithinimicrobium sp.]
MATATKSTSSRSTSGRSSSGSTRKPARPAPPARKRTQAKAAHPEGPWLWRATKSTWMGMATVAGGTARSTSGGDQD